MISENPIVLKSLNADHNPARQSWATPKLLFSHLQDEFQFDLDVAASAKNAKCDRFFTAENSGLENVWGPGASVWCNPPYEEIGPWMSRAALAARKWETRSTLLVPASVDTSWFHGLVAPCAAFWFFRGRIAFRPPPGVKSSGAPSFGCMLAHFGPGVVPGYRGGRCPKTGRPI